jgi:predicted RNase H-like HicB family nuclease
MKKDNFDGFTVNITLDDDGDWLAHLVELHNISAFADSPQKALTELGIAWKGVKQSYRKHGETIPAPPTRKTDPSEVNIQLNKRLHRALVREAAQSGISLTALIARKLARSTVRPTVKSA